MLGALAPPQNEAFCSGESSDSLGESPDSQLRERQICILEAPERRTPQAGQRFAAEGPAQSGGSRYAPQNIRSSGCSRDAEGSPKPNQVSGRVIFDLPV